MNKVLFLITFLSMGLLFSQENLVKNLLRESEVVDHNLSSTKGIEKIFDGKHSTSFSLPEFEALPVTITFGFPKVVTVSRVHFTLPVGTQSQPLAIEILGSGTSPQLGMNRLAKVKLAQGATSHSFAVKQTTIRYLQLRIISSTDQKSFSLSEVELFGFHGRPTENYEFQFSPVSTGKILEHLNANSTISLKFSAQEQKLFQDSRDGSLDEFTLAEAALIASGVDNPSEQQLYLAQLDNIFKRVKNNLRSGLSKYDQGRYLFAYLHKYHFNRYDAKATSLKQLLDSGTYNCASSSILYSIIGRRMGLDLRGVEVPDHTFSILYDNHSHWDIETTSRYGFDFERSAKAHDLLYQETGFQYVSGKKYRLRREISPLGQIAIIYYNHGVELSAQKQFSLSNLQYFKALLLDSKFNTAIKNTLANFANYGHFLSRQNKFSHAEKVLSLGLQVAPKDLRLRNSMIDNYHNWGVFLLRESRYEEAVQIFDTAQKRFPEERNFLSNIAFVYYQRALDVSGRDLEQALQIMDFAIWETKDQEIVRYLEKAKESLFIQHARQHRQQKNWQQAIKLYQQGLLVFPESDDLKLACNTSYLEWAEYEADRGNFVRGIEIYRKALRNDPSEWRFHNNIQVLYMRKLRIQLFKKEYSEAFDLMADLFENYPEDAKVANNLLFVYQNWNQHLLKENQYQESARRYQEITRRLPQFTEVGKIYLGQTHKFAMELAKNDNWLTAAHVYRSLYGSFKKDSSVRNNLLFIYQNLGRQLQNQKKIDLLAKSFYDVTQMHPELESLRKIGGQLLTEELQKMSKQGRLEKAPSYLFILLLIAGDNEIIRHNVAYFANRIYLDLKRSKKNVEAWNMVEKLYSAAPNDKRIRSLYKEAKRFRE